TRNIDFLVSFRFRGSSNIAGALATVEISTLGRGWLWFISAPAIAKTRTYVAKRRRRVTPRRQHSVTSLT
ncbi:MAG: hypothetical protein ABI655_08025, partial [Phenylobacterium sp.]